MFNLPIQFKNKLVKDLHKESNLKDAVIYFKDCLLCCSSQDNGTICLDFSELTVRYSYTELLEVTKQQINDILETQLQIKEALKNIPYEQFIKKIKAIKLDKPTIDSTFHYKYGDKLFQFTATSICFDKNGKHQIQVCISKDILDAHNVDADKFFKDVADCYMKDGVNILKDSFPTH